MKFLLKFILLCIILWIVGIIYFILHDEIIKYVQTPHEELNNEIPIDENRHLMDQSLFDKNVYINEKQLNKNDDRYKYHKFNQWRSDKIPWDRQLPDTRHTKCNLIVYPRELPITSVIITFHNEARSTLLRTVKSVLSRTPSHLLKEIILIDDYSDDPNDGNLLLFLPKIKLIRNRQREGLIRSRISGAEAATSDVLTFLDSHCEANVHWLEPLLTRIKDHPKSVVCPVIDIIQMDSFKYLQTSSELKGGFDWNMHFKWDALSKDERKNYMKHPTDPIKTPMIAGGLFSISKDWFYKLGKYDHLMNIWGGENLEISFKTWMCGGRMEIIPCSRVGHVFRKQHPYTFPDGNGFTYISFLEINFKLFELCIVYSVVEIKVNHHGGEVITEHSFIQHTKPETTQKPLHHQNVQRITEVWMDSYKKYFYKARGGMIAMSKEGLEERKELRRSLKCRSFKWYLENIYPELRIPSQDNMALGELKQITSKNPLCITNLSNFKIAAQTCHLQRGNQDWSLTKSGLIRSNSGHCLKALENDKVILLTNCDNKDSNQLWKIMIRDRIRHHVSGLCMELHNKLLILTPCKEHTIEQMWRFSVRFYY